MQWKLNISFIFFTFLLCAKLSYASAQPLFEPQDINNLWYVWSGYDGHDTDIYCSQWDGINWTKPYQLTDNTTNDFSPAVAIDRNGNPWVVWVGLDGINTSIYCRYWDGNNWRETRQVDDVDIYSDTTPTITVDKDNTSWITWAGSDGIDDDIYISHWDGKNWTSSIMVNTDDSTPDVMPVISNDKKDNIIIVWSGFDNGRYKLFFNQRIKNNWSIEKHILDEDRFSVDLPSALKRMDGSIELIWLEKNLVYCSLWDGKEWSSPKDKEILLPTDFFINISKEQIGPGYTAWEDENIFQSIRVIIPESQHRQKYITAGCKIETLLVWLKDQILPSALAGVEPNKYIAFGDSITEGGGVQENYPSRLERKLDEGIGPSTVVNEGIGGERTFQGLARIDDVLTTHNAQFILIMEGTNDIIYQYSTETIIFNLGEIIEHSKNFGTTPLIAQLTPRQDFLDNRVKEDVNPAIVNMAKEKTITCVDQYTEMAKDKSGYMQDTVHPNDEGYELMAQTWYNAIYTIHFPPEEEEDSGCGSIYPVYPNNKPKGLYINLIPLSVILLVILFLRLKLLIHGEEIWQSL